MSNMRIRSRSSQKQSEAGRRRKSRLLWLRVAAILMVIIFLAGECATLVPQG